MQSELSTLVDHLLFRAPFFSVLGGLVAAWAPCILFTMPREGQEEERTTRPDQTSHTGVLERESSKQILSCPPSFLPFTMSHEERKAALPALGFLVVARQGWGIPSTPYPTFAAGLLLLTRRALIFAGMAVLGICCRWAHCVTFHVGS